MDSEILYPETINLVLILLSGQIYPVELYCMLSRTKQQGAGHSQKKHGTQNAALKK